MIGTLISYMMNLDIYCIGDKMSNAANNEVFNFYIPDINNFFNLFSATLAGLIIIDSLLTCVIADNLTSSKHLVIEKYLVKDYLIYLLDF